MLQNKELILEILAEGGSINLYRQLVDKNKQENPQYQFSWSTNEMALEDDDGLYGASGNRFQSIQALLEYLIDRYPNMYAFYCEFIHNDYKLDILNFIRNKIAERKINIDEMDSLNSWLEQLQISKNDLLTTSDNNSVISKKKNEGNFNLNTIPTGFGSLDHFLTGWPKGSLTVIGGRPGMGKTAFVLSMIRNIAVDHKIPVAVFSFEMTPHQVIKRLFSIETGISIEKFRTGKLNTMEWELLNKKMDTILDAPFYIDDSKNLSIFELFNRARKVKTKFNVGVIIIDYLQLMAEQINKKGNREQDILNILQGLKSLAKELDIPVIVLSQLSRKVEERVDISGHKRPQLSDLRNFKAIDQNADIIGFVYRPEYYKIEQWEDNTSSDRQASFIIAKQPNGQTGCVRFNFKSECGCFTDFEVKN